MYLSLLMILTGKLSPVEKVQTAIIISLIHILYQLLTGPHLVLLVLIMKDIS